MNKSQLVDAIAEKTGGSKADAAKHVDAFVAVVGEALQNGDEVALIGFGTFKVAERSARKGRNPQTGKEIDIAASKSATFKCGKALKDSLN